MLKDNSPMPRELRVWHPAIARYSPNVSFGLLTLMMSYDSVMGLKENFCIYFLATEKWNAELYEGGQHMRTLSKQVFNFSMISSYGRQGRTVTLENSVRGRMMEIALKLVLANERGHPVILREFHPTIAANMTIVPPSMVCGVMKGYSDIIEQCDFEDGLITPAVRKMMRVCESGKVGDLILKKDSGAKWVNAALTPMNSRLMQALNIIDPNLTGIGGSSAEHVKTMKLLRACHCVASEILRPSHPEMLIMWTIEEM